MYRTRPVSRRRPLLHIATAALGFAALGLGWRLMSAEPASARDFGHPAQAEPADYIPATASPGWASALASDPLASALPPATTASMFGAPLDFLRVTSSFGLRRHPLLGFTRMHQGVDFAARQGAPVLAAADGVVTEAGRDGGYGNILRLRHADGWSTGYAHLSGYAVGLAPGTRVLKGQVIGFVGQTGLATGPHLHYEVSRDGVKLDPMTTPFGEAPTPDAGQAPAAPAPTTVALRLRPAQVSDEIPPGV